MNHSSVDSAITSAGVPTPPNGPNTNVEGISISRTRYAVSGPEEWRFAVPDSRERAVRRLPQPGTGPERHSVPLSASIN
jgi:hypothetical protein